MKRAAGDYHKSDLVCPYCYASQMDAVYDGSSPRPFNDPEPWECCSCEKKFLASTEIVFNTKTDCEVAGDQHEFKEDEDVFGIYAKSNMRWFECVKCDEHKHEKLNEPKAHT